MSIDVRGVRLTGIVFMAGAKVLDTLASVYALSVAPEYISESLPVGLMAYEMYGPRGMAIATAVSIVMLYTVVEYGTGYLREHDDSPHRKKNLLAVYALGYWTPGAWWLWAGLYNINLFYTLTSSGVPVPV